MGRQTRKKKLRKGIVKASKEFIELPKDSKGRLSYRGPKDPPWDKVPNKKSKGTGIYALYDDWGLYYVGLTTSSLRSRIRKHLRDKHKKKWKRFSWFRTSTKYAKDLETAIIHITGVKGNKAKGKFKKNEKNEKKRKKRR